MKNLTKLLPAVLVLCVFAGAGLASDDGGKASGALAARLRDLKKSYNAELTKYYEPFQKAKTDEERAKINLDISKHPAKTYLPQFEAIAKEAGKTDTAFDAWMMVYEAAQGCGDNNGQILALDTVVRDFVDSPKMSRVASMVNYAIYAMPTKERKAKIDGWTAALRKSRSPDVQAAMIYSEASAASNYGMGDTAKAKALFAKVIADYPTSTYAKSAEADIFEIDHLSVGMIAPDFTASDEDGKEFKLSDYRGKVVVLDFWGFW